MSIKELTGPQTEHKEREPKSYVIGTEISNEGTWRFWQIKKWQVMPMEEGIHIEVPLFRQSLDECYYLIPPQSAEGFVKEEVVERKPVATSFSSDEEYKQAYGAKEAETSIAGTFLLVSENLSNDPAYDGMSYEIKVGKNGDLFLIYNHFSGSEVAEGTDSYLVKTNPSAHEVIEFIQRAKNAPAISGDYECEKGKISDLRAMVSQIQDEEKRRNVEEFIQSLSESGILKE